MENLAPEYGRGKNAERWWSSCMAVISFLLGSILTIWAGCALYLIPQPQTGGDSGGLGAFLSVLGIFMRLATATLICGPLGFLLGLGAAASLNKDPDRQLAKLLAWFGMLLSFLVMAVVAIGYAMVSQ